MRPPPPVEAHCAGGRVCGEGREGEGAEGRGGVEGVRGEGEGKTWCREEEKEK